MSNRERNILIYLALLLAVCGGIAGVFGMSGLKNIRFITPILLLPLCFSSKIKSPHAEQVQPLFKKLLILYTILTVYTFFSNQLYFESGFTYRNIVNIVLIFTPLVVMSAISRTSSQQEHSRFIDFLFFCFIGVFFIELAKKGISLASILSVFQANLVTDSDYETESGVSLILGFYTLHYLHQKNKLYCFLAFFFTFLGAKRIAIFGVILCILLYYVYPYLMAHLKYRGRMAFAIVFALIGLFIASAWHGIITGEYDKVVEDATGLSVNRFFMGRIGRFEVFLTHLRETTGYGMGYGIGYVENVLYYGANYQTAFHNDYYRLYLEFGPLSFAIWLGFILYHTAPNRLAFCSTMLIVILMQTDNVFMYDRVMYSYLIVCTFSLKYHST